MDVCVLVAVYQVNRALAARMLTEDPKKAKKRLKKLAKEAENEIDDEDGAPDDGTNYCPAGLLCVRGSVFARCLPYVCGTAFVGIETGFR